MPPKLCTAAFAQPGVLTPDINRLLLATTDTRPSDLIDPTSRTKQ